MGFKEELTFKEFVRFLLPSIAVMAMMSAYAIVDGYFVSMYVGSDALAAMNLILPVNSIIFSVGLMFASGGGAYAAIRLGKRDQEGASKFFSNLLMVAIAFALFAMLAAFALKQPILKFLGVNESLYHFASVYSRYTFITFPLLISKMIFAGFLRSQGKPDISLKMSTLGGILNIILDYIFIVILDMGVAGAGLATLIGIGSALIYAGFYFSSDASLIRFKMAAIDFSLIGKTMINGSSEMVSELAVGFTALVLNILTLKYLGNDGVAAIAVIMYINLFASMVFQGFAIGVSPLLSYHYGANNYQTLKNIRKYAARSIFVISILVTLIVSMTSKELVLIFFDSGNSAYRIATEGLFIVAFAYLFMGANVYGSAMYTAFSNGKISALISVSKTFLFFTIAAYSLPSLLGAKGIWFILPVAEVAAASVVFYFTRDKQLKRYVHFQESLVAEAQ